MADPLVSIVIPTYGRAALLEDAVASVLRQTVQDFECIVVDDASPQPVRYDHPRVRVERLERNSGSAAALNHGVAVARGRYVTFLDDDDCYTPERLAYACEGLERAPVALCWTAELGGSSTGTNRVLEGDVSAIIRNAVTPNVGQTAVRRESFIPFDVRYRASQDVDWWIRVAQVHAVTTVPKVGHLYRRHDGPRNLNGPLVRSRAMLEMWDVHAEYFAAHPRASAFHLRRAGLTALTGGDFHTARRILLRSLRVRPELRTLRHLVTASFPGPRRRRSSSAPFRRQL